MDTLHYLFNGFGVALTATNLGVAALGALIGTIVGMLPGLGPINGVAILMPLAFALKLPPETALILLAAVYMGCEFGGRISSILLNVPGDAGAIMTAMDGYPMARQGLAGVALSISAWSSFIGSLVATTGIVLFAPLLARWALAFGPAEYFALMCFAFACITGLMGDAPMKAALAAVMGLSLSTVGLDSNSGVYRFTGGDVHLSDGIQFIVVVIGVFSISEILLMLEQHHSSDGIIKLTGRALFNLKEVAHTWWCTLRSAVVGFVVGVLPGAGATIASAMTYAMEKRIAGESGKFGEGDIRASYSGDRIGMDQPVRRPFAWRGGLWIAASFEGIGGNTAEVYRLVDPGAFEGKPTTYREKTRNAEAARNDPLGFYHGMAVKCRGETFVLCGPPVLLIPASRVQLGLFDDDPPDA